MVNADLPGPHHEPAGRQQRVAVECVAVQGGARCTLLWIWCAQRGMWTVYLETDPARSYLVPREELARMLTGLTEGL